MNKRTLIWTLPVVALMTLAGCKNQGEGTGDSATPQEQQGTQVVIEGFTDTVELELVPWEEEPVPEAEPAAPKKQRAETQHAVPQQTGNKTRNNGKAETIYVETYGAQGRVWGHVTMKGDRGTGTIHDWDENTLAVTVTRHGDELFAVDQNSRQYVFKIRN